jgi:hypothetical protein
VYPLIRIKHTLGAIFLTLFCVNAHAGIITNLGFGDPFDTVHSRTLTLGFGVLNGVGNAVTPEADFTVHSIEFATQSHGSGSSTGIATYAIYAIYAIYDDNGPGGLPGTELFSTIHAPDTSLSLVENTLDTPLLLNGDETYWVVAISGTLSFKAFLSDPSDLIHRQQFHQQERL